MTTPPRTPISLVNTAREAAALERASWLMALHTDEQLTAMDLIRHAATHEGRALRRLPLRRVLVADGWSETRARAVVERMRRRFRVGRARTLTVGWLFDNRVQGIRFGEWVGLTTPDRRTPPWTQWPFPPEPAYDTNVAV